MKYRVTLKVTDTWVVEVEAGDAAEAGLLAREAFDDSPNPWEDLEPIGDGEVIVDAVKEVGS